MFKQLGGVWALWLHHSSWVWFSLRKTWFFVVCCVQSHQEVWNVLQWLTANGQTRMPKNNFFLLPFISRRHSRFYQLKHADVTISEDYNVGESNTFSRKSIDRSRITVIVDIEGISSMPYQPCRKRSINCVFMNQIKYLTRYFTTIFTVFSFKHTYCLTLCATHVICVRDIRAINPDRNQSWNDRTKRNDDKTRICCRQNRQTFVYIYYMWTCFVFAHLPVASGNVRTGHVTSWYQQGR